MTRIYLNELAPWQRKNEYYQKIQLGKDLVSQTEQLNKQVKANTAAQLEGTDRMIASQNKIREITSKGFYDVSQGIEGLKASFEWGISEVVWQIEQNREVLKSIEEGIWSPYDAQARNKKKQAEEAYSYGWIDEAEKFFLESEEILQTDFSVHMSLGMIYMFKKIDKQKALSRFEKAIKYARPKSNYYTSIALMHKAMIHFDFNEINVAIESAKEAVDLSPNLAFAHYQLAQYLAQSNQKEKFTTSLRTAIELDKLFSVRVQNDNFFDSVRANVNDFLLEITKREKEIADKQLLLYKNKINKLYPLIREIQKNNFIKSEKDTKRFEENLVLIKKFESLEKQYIRDSYFDNLFITNDLMPNISKATDSLINELKENVANVVNKLEADKQENESYAKSGFGVASWTAFTWAGIIVLLGSFIVPMIAALIFLDSWDKLAFIFWAIPVISQIISIAGLYFLIIDDGFLVYQDGTLWSEGDIYIVWSLFIFSIVVIVYYFLSKAKIIKDIKTETAKNSNLLDIANSINTRLNNLLS